MVALEVVRASNSALATALPNRLVGVFVGATSGIGEYTLKSFARYVAAPRAYFIGRNQAAGERIATECRELNPRGEFHFVQADTSLLANVDRVCNDIKKHETELNVLVLTQGTLSVGAETAENLHLPLALVHYARARFIAQLMPLLENASALRRVVSIFTGGFEGHLDLTDIQRRSMARVTSNPLAGRAHASSLITLHLAHFATEHPTVSFEHTFPGFVRSNIGRETKGIMRLMSVVSGLLGRWFYIPDEESGDRHLYLATSARYPAKISKGVDQGVDGEGKSVRAIDGVLGGGLYVVNEKCEPAAPKVEGIVKTFKEDGTMDAVWKDLEEQWTRIMGPTVA